MAAQEPEEALPAEAAPVLRTTVHGVVLNAAYGQPLGRALVRIEGEDASGTLTDGEGRFEIPDVPLGTQAFQVLKPGFRDPFGTNADHFVVVAAKTPPLVFSLTPTCSISGRVDLSTGDPANGITVQLLKQAMKNGRAIWGAFKFIRTSTEGAYRFGNLPDGVYTLYTQPSTESIRATTLIEPGRAASVEQSGYPQTFYPNARELGGAARIQLSPGEQAQANMTLALEPFHTVTATILGPDGAVLNPKKDDGGGHSNGWPAPLLFDTENHELAYIANYDETTHTVQAALPDGTYTMTVAIRGNAVLGRPVDDGRGREPSHPNYFAGSATFSIAGHAVGDLQIPLLLPHSYLLHLRAQEGGANSGQASHFPTDRLTSAVRVTLGYAGEYVVRADSERAANIAGSDAFDLMLAPPFSYWVHTKVYGQGLCAGTLSASGANLARDPLVLSYSGSAASMELTVRNDCARLELNLPAALASTGPGVEPVYTVYVVPDFDTTEDVEPQTLRPSDGEGLTLEGLTPGDYHVYTFTAPVDLEYRNPAAMSQLPTRGQAVTLSPGRVTALVLEAPAR
jgi:hypothetical protein